MRIHCGQRAEFAIQESRDQPAKGGFVSGEAKPHKRNTALLKRARKQFGLRAFAGAIYTFNDDELPTSHTSGSV